MSKTMIAAIFVLLNVASADAKDNPFKTASLPSHGVIYESPVLTGALNRRMAPGVRAKRKTPRAVARGRSTKGYSTSLDKVVPALAVKAREIVAACGSVVVSAHRPGARVRGTRTMSLHSRTPAEAVDLKGNPACIYSHLHGWRGGYSTDYARVKHVHISLSSDGRESGKRFAHGHSKKRYAKAKRRYAYAR
jgi:hypothetical protein